MTSTVEYFAGGSFHRSADYPHKAMGHSAAAISDNEILSCGGDFIDFQFDWSKEYVYLN